MIHHQSSRVGFPTLQVSDLHRLQAARVRAFPSIQAFPFINLRRGMDPFAMRCQISTKDNHFRCSPLLFSPLLFVLCSYRREFIDPMLSDGYLGSYEGW